MNSNQNTEEVSSKSNSSLGVKVKVYWILAEITICHGDSTR